MNKTTKEGRQKEKGKRREREREREGGIKAGRKEGVKE